MIGSTEVVYRPWDELREIFRRGITVRQGAGQRYVEVQQTFAEGRVDEGIGVAEFLEGYAKLSGRRLRVLDLGAGNGGISLALANHRRFEVFSLDLVPNPDLRAVKANTGLPIRPVVGSGSALPFPDETFDVVVCLETLEHVTEPEKFCPELIRVLEPRGVCMLTTPARIPLLFSPDPHFGVRGLYLLPDPVQEWVVKRWFMRGGDVAGHGDYDVHHTYWTLSEIGSLFPQPRWLEPLFNVFSTGEPPRPMTRLWWRWLLGNYSWDRILVHKEEGGDPFTIGGWLAFQWRFRALLREYEGKLADVHWLMVRYGVETVARSLESTRASVRMLSNRNAFIAHLKTSIDAAEAEGLQLFSGVYFHPRAGHRLSEAEVLGANDALSKATAALRAFAERTLAQLRDE